MRYLKWLVTTLTVTMIVGLIVLIALVVMRFNRDPAPAFPDTIALPEGATASAVTRGDGFLVVVTTDGEVLVFDPSGATLRQTIKIEPQD